jgi:uncharacterized protein (DUF2236 family)
VAGVDPVTGQSYRADDPELLRWVHCCEVDSFQSTAQRIGVLRPAEADDYVAEQAAAGRLVGVPERLLPRSTADLADYFDAVRPQLRRTPAAAGLAFALLPRWARRMYGLPGLPTTDLGATAAVLSLRTALRMLPVGMREGPHLRAARERLGEEPATAGRG